MERLERTVVAIFGLQPLRIGGIERYTRELARQLQDRNVRLVAIFAGPAQGDVRQFLRADNLTLVSAPGLDVGLWANLPVIIRTLRETRPIVFHYQFLSFLGPLPWLARAYGVRRVIFTAHASNPASYEARRAPLLKRLATRFINAPVSEITCVSEYTRNALIALDVLPAKRFNCIYNGIEAPLSHETRESRLGFRRRFGIPDGCELVIQVASLIPEKGVADFLEAVPLVLAERPNTHFALVGDGGGEVAFRRQAQELGVAQSVSFTGLVQDPLREGVYAASDIICLASRWQEAFGLVLGEAMISARPVVATRVGGIPEVVEDGRTGLLAAAKNPADLAAQLLRLLGDPELRFHMGQAGRTTAQAKFDLKEKVREIVSLYDL
jgi:glycosyltransferase involved in cell wall biosynthesis